MFNIFACIRFFQCCGSGMIYSGSGSSSEFSEFRIRIQAKVPDPCGSGSNPCYLIIFGNCKQNHLKPNSIIKKNLSTICHFLLNTTVLLLQYTESRIHTEITFLPTVSALSYLAGSGSGSRQKFRIHAEPDPRHFFLEQFNEV